MSTKPNMNDDLADLERALGSLLPAASRVDRDQLFYQAGAAANESASRRRGWPGRVTTIALAASVLVLATLLAMRVADRQHPEIVFVYSDGPSTGNFVATQARREASAHFAPETEARYLRLRQQVLTGDDAWAALTPRASFSGQGEREPHATDLWLRPNGISPETKLQ